MKLTIGPMFAGKTTSMLALADKLRRNNKSFIIICHPLCARKNYIISHNNESIECAVSLDIDLTKYEYVLIDEVQFFDDIVNKLKPLQDKKIYLYGLDTDYKRRPFPTICDLLSICSKVKKLNGICARCGRKSAFTERIDKVNDELIDISNEYLPVCLPCHR